MGNCFFIGDSITAGFWGSQGGWVNLVIQDILKKQASDPQLYCACYNLGISGDTGFDILKRLKRETKPRLKSEKNNVVVYAFGTNDSQWLINKDRPNVSEHDFEKNVIKLIKRSKKNHLSPYFIGLLPVDEPKVFPCPWRLELGYSNDYIATFERVLKRVCLKHNVPFLPLFEKWQGLPHLTDLLSDGLHPNTAGRDLLAEQISTFLLTEDFWEFYRE